MHIVLLSLEILYKMCYIKRHLVDALFSCYKTETIYMESSDHITFNHGFGH